MRWLKFLGGVLVGAVCVRAAIAQQPVGKPNIVLVVIDDMGAHDLGCTGSKWYETPAIDQMAKDGMVFNQAYAACAVCSPTRAAIMTGKYPARLHMTDWIPGEGNSPKHLLKVAPILKELPANETTIAEMLKQQGYATGYVGKWHLGGKGSLPTDHGFDSCIASGEIGHPASYFYPFGKPTESHRVPDLAKDGKEGEYLTDRLTVEANSFIEKNKDRPFFLMLAHYAVHVPLMAKDDDRNYFKSKATVDGQKNATYAAMVRSVDQSMASLRAELKSAGVDQNTLILFTSDNGGLTTGKQTSNAPLRDGKCYPYEGGLRIPLIAVWPGHVRAGSTCDTPVISNDYMSTFAQLTGATAPANDGLSIVPLLVGNGLFPDWRTLFWHYPHYWNGEGVRPYGVVRSGDFKLIEFYEKMNVELYNLKEDPSETKDLATALPEKANELREKLHHWRTDVGALMPTPNPTTKPSSN